jgi:hypothetical protein
MGGKGGIGREMTQTLYAHMNKIKIFLKIHNSSSILLIPGKPHSLSGRQQTKEGCAKWLHMA